MQTKHTNHCNNHLLRFVFSNRVVSFNLARSVTYGDVAQFSEMSRQRYGEPLAIDVTMGGHDAVGAVAERLN